MVKSRTNGISAGGLVVRGAGLGLVAGLVFGLFEAFYGLALVEDLFSTGLDRRYATHWGMVWSMVGFDALFGLVWGILGALVFRIPSRREGPVVNADPFLCAWTALIPTVLYPGFFLFSEFLKPESRYAAFFWPITLVWLVIAGVTCAVVLWAFAFRFQRSGGVALNLLASVALAWLVLGAAYVNSSPYRSILSPASILINIVLVAAGLGGLYLLFRLTANARFGKGLAVGVAVVLIASALYVRYSDRLTYRRGSWEGPGREHPNVIVIVLDTQRLDRLGTYNSDLKVSPNLDALARDSVVYENCVATSSWTLPSHASLFTGLYPTAHAAHNQISGGLTPDNPDRMAAVQMARPLRGRKTLTEHFSEAGYRTGAVCGNCGYLTPVFGMSPGFDFYDSRMPQPFRMRPVVDLLLSPMRDRLPFDYTEAGYDVEPQRKTYRCARSVTHVARNWLEANDRDRFFLFLNFCDPHAPYIPPREFDIFPGQDPSIRSPSARDVSDNQREVTPELRRHLLSLYDGEIYYMDHHIGLILDDLKARGLYDETLIVVTSDHGEFFGEHGRLGHGGDLWEAGVEIPLIVKAPGPPAGRRDASRVSLVDIMPSVLEMAGLEVPEGLDGRAFDEGDRPVVAELHPSADRILAFGERMNRTLTAYYDGPWKLLETARHEVEPAYALYHLERDPQERTDLAAVEPEVLARLIAGLEGWREDALGKRLPDSGEDSANFDNALLRNLEHLGYIGGGRK